MRITVDYAFTCGKWEIMERTVALNHEGLDNVVADHLKVGVTDPVRDRGLGAGEEVIEDSNFMAEEHQAVNQMRPDETGTTGNKNALALRWRKQLDGREAGEGGVGDGVAVGVEDRLGLVRSVVASELGVLSLLLLRILVRGGGDDIVGAQVE